MVGNEETTIIDAIMIGGKDAMKRIGMNVEGRDRGTLD
jgi:hypothetical protein